MQVLTLSDVVSVELLVLSVDYIDDAHVQVSLWFDIAEFFLKEALEWRTIVKASLEEEATGDATEPTLVELGVCCVSPESFHP